MKYSDLNNLSIEELKDLYNHIGEILDDNIEEDYEYEEDDTCSHSNYRAGHSPFVPCICNDCGEEI